MDFNRIREEYYRETRMVTEEIFNEFTGANGLSKATALSALPPVLFSLTLIYLAHILDHRKW